MLTGSLGRIRNRVQGPTPRCPETSEIHDVQWLHGTAYCDECGQALEISRPFVRRRFEHPD